MSNGCFATNYQEARAKFREAAIAAGAVLQCTGLGKRGPDGAELATDVAWLCPTAPKGVMVTISGTHGVEGFFGSALQIEWLRRLKSAPLPDGVGVLHVHAINPYGFAWLRRTNESNIDINRNWMDFDQALPGNAGYDELADDLCPREWTQESQARTGARLAAWIERHEPLGAAIFQQAVTGGQWNHPDGLFYGGMQISWSRRTLTEILTSTLQSVGRVCVIDFHTGLGPYGYAEPIIGFRRSTPQFMRTRSWIGAAAKSLHGDGSVSSEIKGDALSAIPALLPHAAVDVVALECGIRPVEEVAFALRADAWLHAYGDPSSSIGRSIKESMRRMFHSDDILWQGMALGQGLAACHAAIAELKLSQ